MPHRGSHVAAMNQVSKNLFWPSVEVQELREREYIWKNIFIQIK